MDKSSRTQIAPIIADVRARVDAARRITPGGILNEADMAGIFRRVASNHGCTAPDVKRWWEAAQSEPQEELQA